MWAKTVCPADQACKQDGLAAGAVLHRTPILGKTQPPGWKAKPCRDSMPALRKRVVFMVSQREEGQ